ncbi:MAG: ATP-binding protein [Chloroflexota bacterium]
MTKVHHLESKLKALKLGGMLDTLELRLDQATKDRLGYVEFLELLLEDELQRRANKSLAARIQKARFEGVKAVLVGSLRLKLDSPARKNPLKAS